MKCHPNLDIPNATRIARETETATLTAPPRRAWWASSCVPYQVNGLPPATSWKSIDNLSGMHWKYMENLMEINSVSVQNLSEINVEHIRNASEIYIGSIGNQLEIH